MTRRVRSALGAGPPGKEVVVDGVRLAYDDEGSGPALRLPARDRRTARATSRGCARGSRARYRVIALDWPGQGSSGDDREPPSAARYAALLAGFSTRSASRDVVLLGNSIGGAAAIRFAAARSRARARRSCSSNSGGLDRRRRLARAVTRAMARVLRRRRARRALVPARVRRLLPPACCPRAPARAQRERIVAAAREIAPRAAPRRGAASASRTPTSARSRRGSRCPVLFAWAKRDRVRPARALNRAAIRRIPDARARDLPGRATRRSSSARTRSRRTLAAFLDALTAPRHPAA